MNLYNVPQNGDHMWSPFFYFELCIKSFSSYTDSMRHRQKKHSGKKVNISFMSRIQKLYTQISTPRYITTQKALGETPLVATERMRRERHIPRTTPLAYAGRLDPMATGTLLILVGDECKKQTQYHILDKVYTVELLIGVHSDSGDVLGIASACAPQILTLQNAQKVCDTLIGNITLPYPHFSAKTVQGKPLHTWTLEHRLHEIDLPIKESTLYTLTATSLKLITKNDLLKRVSEKIASIPEVHDPRKQLGADFRRTDVQKTWNIIAQSNVETYQILSFTCTASSGTYMRSLAEKIAQELGTCGLALSIHRTTIGKYRPLWGTWGIWTKKY